MHYALIVRCARRVAQNYEYVVEQQPIGKELFRQFCRGEVEGGKSLPSVATPKSSLDNKTLLDFLDAVVCTALCALRFVVCTVLVLVLVRVFPPPGFGFFVRLLSYVTGTPIGDCSTRSRKRPLHGTLHVRRSHMTRYTSFVYYTRMF